MYYFEYLGNAADRCAVKCTFVCMQILDCVCVSMASGLLSKYLISILLSLHSELYIYSKSTGPLLAVIRKLLVSQTINQSAVWTHCLTSELTRESVGFFLALESHTCSLLLP